MQEPVREKKQMSVWLSAPVGEQLQSLPLPLYSSARPGEISDETFIRGQKVVHPLFSVISELRPWGLTYQNTEYSGLLLELKCVI